MGEPPDSAVLAFGGEPDQLRRLSGGQGTSWRAGDVVLKPANPGPLYGWMGTALRRVPDTADFRLARPVAADGRWEIAGWSAFRLVITSLLNGDLAGELAAFRPVIDIAAARS